MAFTAIPNAYDPKKIGAGLNALAQGSVPNKPSTPTPSQLSLGSQPQPRPGGSVPMGLMNTPQAASPPTSSQQSYMQNLSQQLTAQPVAAQPVAAQQTAPQTAAPQSQGSYPGQLSTAQIAAEAQARIDKQRAGLVNAVTGAKTGAKNTYDYTQGLQKDNRVLEDAQLRENLNPFSGGTDYKTAMLSRDRQIADTASSKDYNNTIAGYDAQVASFDTLAPAQQQAAVDELTRIERQYGIDLSAVTGQINGQKTAAQANADRTFNYNAGQDKITNDRNATNDTITNNRNSANDKATYTGNYTSPETTAIQQKMAANSAAYAAATPQEQERLHQENMSLSAKLGQTYNPGTGTYSGGNTSSRTIAGKTLDLNNAKDMATLTGYMSDGRGGYIPTNAKQQENLTNAWKETEQMGMVTPVLSKLTGIPVGTPTQTAKNQAAQIAVSNRNATNSENSTANSGANMKQDNLMNIWKATGKAPAGIPNVAEGTAYVGTSANKSTVNPKVSTDNHATISQDLKSAANADEANALIEANRNNLTDADYKDLKKKIIDQF